MPRKPRIEYAGAVYHVMNRGDQGDAIFKDKLDYENFLVVLGECCKRSGWNVHAYVLMPNHFHLLIETPQPTLVQGMKWFMGAYTQKFNRRHGLRGHAFQGRYKAVLIESERGGYFETVSTYIHLNPARARLLSGDKPDLSQYAWSSYRFYTDGGGRPAWLDVRRVLGNLDLKDDREGLGRYRAYMRERMKELRTRDGKKMYQAAWKPVRHGWCMGGAEFEEFLLKKLKGVVTENKRESYSGEAIARHNEAEAERLVKAGMKVLGMVDADLDRQRKGSREKSLLAWLVQEKTLASQNWISNRLKMGATSMVGNHTKRVREAKDATLHRLRQALEKC
jgi:REP element-mobilizing transposase RayT